MSIPRGSLNDRAKWVSLWACVSFGSAQYCLVSSNAGNGRGKTVLVASDESELRFTPAIQHMVRVLVHCATLSMVCKVHVYV